MDREGAPQGAEPLAPRPLGEDPSQNGDYSDETDGQQQIACDAPGKHKSLLVSPLAALGAEGLEHQPQRADRRRAVEQIAEEGVAGQAAVLTTEHVRHNAHNSGEREQPHQERRNPPEHDSASF